MTTEELKRLFPNASRSTIARNRSAVGAVVPAERELDTPSPLVPKRQVRQRGKGRAQIIVTLVACRHREIDDDNSAAGFKPLRDEIAKVLGVDDADGRVQFRYGQVECVGQQGSIVKIETVNAPA
jgi:hypothetical protein